MAEKLNGSKFLLYVMDGTTPVRKLISEQLGLTLAGSTATIDVTSKTNAGWDEFIGGLQSGEASVDMIMDASINALTDKVNYAEMSGFKVTRVVKQYVAELVGPTKTLTRNFYALITKFDVGAPMEDKITVSMTLKQSGPPTETITSTV